MQKLKSFLLFFVGLFRRALCCFRRKRRPSSDSIPLLAVGVVPNNSVNGCADMENWNNWDESNRTEITKPNSIQQHIEMYRQQTLLARQKSTESQEETQENFFEDMAPRITRQTKIFLNSDENNEMNVSSRLSLNPQGIIATVCYILIF